MRRVLLFMLWTAFVQGALGETQVAEVVAVDPAGWIELRQVGLRRALPARLRFPLAHPPPWEPGQAVRYRARSYGDDGWLEQSWPLRPGVAAALADPEWWRVHRRAKAAEGPPWRGILGVDASGQWIRWDDEALGRGFFLVPFLPTQGDTAAVPAALAQAARLQKHLALTEHRDLPWVFWSMQPERDAVENGPRWAEALWGEPTEGLLWVSPCEEFVSAWQRWLRAPLFRVEGQSPVRTPQWFLIDRAGHIAVRYEGWDWALDRLESACDAALLEP